MAMTEQATEVLKDGAVYALHGRLVLARKRTDGGFSLVALGWNGRPTALVFDIVGPQTGGWVVAVAKAPGGDMARYMLDLNRCELAADNLFELRGGK